MQIFLSVLKRASYLNVQCDRPRHVSKPVAVQVWVNQLQTQRNASVTNHHLHKNMTTLAHYHSEKDAGHQNVERTQFRRHVEPSERVVTQLVRRVEAHHHQVNHAAAHGQRADFQKRVEPIATAIVWEVPLVAQDRAETEQEHERIQLQRFQREPYTPKQRSYFVVNICIPSLLKYKEDRHVVAESVPDTERCENALKMRNAKPNARTNDPNVFNATTTPIHTSVSRFICTPVHSSMVVP